MFECRFIKAAGAETPFLCALIAAELLSDLEGAFQEKIDAAYFDTSKYLLDVLNRNYLLLEHLQAMRRYLLLGQGDFIRHLMDLLKLDFPSRHVHRIHQAPLKISGRKSCCEFDFFCICIPPQT